MTLNKKLLKKLPYHIALSLLTAGASLVLGFLCFGGALVLWPSLPIAFGAFVLSIAYEGEIYLQNITGALKKLLKPHYLERRISNQYLLEHFPANDECPQFFKDYKAQLKLLHKFEHKRLDKASRKRQKEVERNLRRMEKWFSHQFFTLKNNGEILTPYEQEIHDWLKQPAQQRDYDATIRRNSLVKFAKWFSFLTGFLMSFGTTYLLVETFAVIPVLATIPFAVLPFLIIPMALVSGAAYGLLTYNAATDMIANDTLKKWYQTLRDDLRKGLSWHTVLMTGTAAFLIALATVLTICTAGTWWSIAKSARPLFSWMAKIPSGFMAFIGFDSILFNLVNTKASWDMIYKATKPGKSHTHDKNAPKESFSLRFFNALRQSFYSLREKENWIQILNPVRLILVVSVTPIRLMMFLLHLLSMGAGDDRVPGVPEQISAGASTTSEFFEDLHYFFHLANGNHHHHDFQDLLEERLGEEGHSHDDDLPSRFIHFIFTPLYALAASWDWAASKLNNGTRPVLSMKQAWNKQRGTPEEQTVDPGSKYDVSPDWHIERTLNKIERRREELEQTWFNKSLAGKKSEHLKELQKNIRQVKPGAQGSLQKCLQEEIDQHQKVYQQHRAFSFFESTTTEDMLSKLHAETVTTSMQKNNQNRPSQYSCP